MGPKQWADYGKSEDRTYFVVFRWEDKSRALRSRTIARELTKAEAIALSDAVNACGERFKQPAR